ncbi:MAG: serine/threonine protein kinase [Planctomycetota bacterium]|nr:serine/threonine protein kinase [Planctomycetota bacterium]
MPMLARLLALLLVACAGGCRHFELQPPEHFVVLDEPEWRGYALRAVNADGVVLAVREVDNDRAGSLTFWVDAIRNRLRTVRGYALLDERPVKAATGEAGHQLRLGRDEGTQTYDYWVTIFVRPPTLLGDGQVIVVEAGGRRDEFARVQDQIGEAIGGLAVR